MLVTAFCNLQKRVMASCGNHPVCLHFRDDIQIVEALDVLSAVQCLGQHVGYLIIGGSAENSVHFRNLVDDLLFIALCEAACDNQRLTLSDLLHLRHLENSIHTLLLGVADKTTCVDDDDIRFVFIIRKGIAVPV